MPRPKGSKNKSQPIKVQFHCPRCGMELRGVITNGKSGHFACHRCTAVLFFHTSQAGYDNQGMPRRDNSILFRT